MLNTSVNTAKLPSAERLGLSRVLVLGDAMLDRYCFGGMDRISPEAPVPVVRITREDERLGGAANVALNVKTLGAQCSLLTVVGHDDAGRTLLQQHGIRAAGTVVSRLGTAAVRLAELVAAG